jgi:prepilin-type N-terminal cleavage/methylation domain-containing protein
MNKLLKQAFTLIELLVVIAIIGILSGLIVVSMSGVTQKANIAKAQVFSNSLRNSLMANLVSEWKFNDLSSAIDGTSIIDSWSGANNLILDINSVAADTSNKVRTGSECVSGNCLFFDGIDDYLYSASGTNSNLDFGNGTTDTSFTVSGWFKLADITDSYLIVKNQYHLFLGGSSHLYLRLYDTSASAFIARRADPITAYLNQWIYIVGTYDGSRTVSGIKLYLNGVRSDNLDYVSGTYVAMETGTDLAIGKISSSYVSGLIDDVRIFNNAITATQIREQYYVGLNSLLINGSITREEYLSRINDYASNN